MSDLINHVNHDMYTNQIRIWWSLGYSKNILMYFRRTKNMFCMRKWQTVRCKGVTSILVLSQIQSIFMSIRPCVLIKRWRSGWKKVPCWIWMSSKVKHCDGYYSEGWVYNCSCSSKGGRLSQEVYFQTWCRSKRVSTMKIYCVTIVTT